MGGQQIKIDSNVRIRRTVIYVLFFFLAVFMATKYCSGQSSELTSPNGVYTVRIVDRALPNADRVMGDYTLILSRGEHILTKVPTTGYLITAMWSPDGRYVAVNNRRGNSGDYVWVFSLNDGKALKKPDDKRFTYPLRKLTKICEDCNEASFSRDLTIAKAWKSSTELEVETRWRFYMTALIIRHAVYRIADRELMLVAEQLDRHPVDWQSPEE